MSPDDPSSPPVSWVGDPLGPPLAGASVDALRQVLGRHRRRQRMLAGWGLAVVLVAGSVAGFAVGQQGRGPSGTQVAVGPQPAASAAGAVPSTGGTGATFAIGTFGPGPAGGNSSPPTQLLVRDAGDGVRVRLYEQSIPKPECAPNAACAQPAVTSGCFPSHLIDAEVSDDQVAGDAGNPVWPSTSGLDPVTVEVVGDGEPQPILVVVAQTGSNVAKVEVETAYGDDAEAPTSSGWVALAVQLPADYQASSSSSNVPAGTLTSLSSTGATISSTDLGAPRVGPIPTSCLPKTPGCPAISASTSTIAGATLTCRVCEKVAAATGAGQQICTGAGGSTGSEGGTGVPLTSGSSGGPSIRVSTGGAGISGSAGAAAGGSPSSAGGSPSPTTTSLP